MKDHDYLRSDERCLDCGGEVLIDVIYDDRISRYSTESTVQSYDCQERDCGSQFSTLEWGTRTRSSAGRNRGSLVAALKGR